MKKREAQHDAWFATPAVPQMLSRTYARCSPTETAYSEAVDLNEAALEVLALMKYELQRNRIVAQTDLCFDQPPIIGDRVQLQQVILNLLLNASDAMQDITDRARHLVIRTYAIEFHGVPARRAR